MIGAAHTPTGSPKWQNASASLLLLQTDFDFSSEEKRAVDLTCPPWLAPNRDSAKIKTGTKYLKTKEKTVSNRDSPPLFRRSPCRASSSPVSRHTFQLWSDGFLNLITRFAALRSALGWLCYLESTLGSAETNSPGGVMTSEGVRRSDRVALTLLLEATGRDVNGQEFRESARTILINRHGAVIVLERDVAPEQRIHLKRRTTLESHREGEARIVGQFGKQNDGFIYGIEVLGDKDLWGVEFPSIAESPEAVARMLLECTYCRSREVVYLNEFELRGFETNRGIARHCKLCGVPSIWIQAAHEDEKKLSGRSRAKKGESGKGAGSEVDPGAPKREYPRVRTRLTACIRQSDADDELAVCEDISPSGMCFRSKRRYEVNTPVDVAVPYSPDTANIFLPARIVYSEAMPKAGLFRHGTEYRRTPPVR